MRTCVSFQALENVRRVVVLRRRWLKLRKEFVRVLGEPDVVG
jgi:hypothetical protein